MDLLEILIKLSQEKEIPYTRKQLEKMTEEKLEMVYEEYKKKELDEFNEAMTDVVIGKLDEYMKKYELIKEDSKLGEKLQNKKLFRKDLKTAISVISPYLPFIGILEGGVTIVAEVVEKFVEEKSSEINVHIEEEDRNPGETQSRIFSHGDCGAFWMWEN